jgi:hypothetical protein
MPDFVTTQTAMRLYWTSKELGEKMTYSEDEVTDFMVKEALVARAHKERERAEKERERDEWKRQAKKEHAQ